MPHNLTTPNSSVAFRARLPLSLLLPPRCRRSPAHCAPAGPACCSRASSHTPPIVFLPRLQHGRRGPHEPMQGNPQFNASAPASDSSLASMPRIPAVAHLPFPSAWSSP